MTVPVYGMPPSGVAFEFSREEETPKEDAVSSLQGIFPDLTKVQAVDAVERMPWFVFFESYEEAIEHFASLRPQGLRVKMHFTRFYRDFLGGNAKRASFVYRFKEGQDQQKLFLFLRAATVQDIPRCLAGGWFSLSSANLDLANETGVQLEKHIKTSLLVDRGSWCR